MAHGISSGQMSGYHWKLRKKGYSYKKALAKVGKAKWLSKRYFNKKMFPGKMKSYDDYDGDGKVNRYDCFPFDKRRQDDYKHEWNTYSEKKLKELAEEQIKEKKRKEKVVGRQYWDYEEPEEDEPTSYFDITGEEHYERRKPKRLGSVEGEWADKLKLLALHNELRNTFDGDHSGKVIPLKEFKRLNERRQSLIKAIRERQNKEEDTTFDFTEQPYASLKARKTAINKTLGLTGSGEQDYYLSGVRPNGNELTPIWKPKGRKKLAKEYFSAKHLGLPEGKTLLIRKNQYYKDRAGKKYYPEHSNSATAEKAAANIGIPKTKRPRKSIITGPPVQGTPYKPSEYVLTPLKPYTHRRMDGYGYRTGKTETTNDMKYPLVGKLKPGKPYPTTFPSSKNQTTIGYDKTNETSYLRDF